MKSNADIVIEHQEKWNHKIHLEKSKKALFVQNYKLFLNQETATMKKCIDEYFGKSFIWPSSSAAASPIFLVWKLKGSLHFCINY